jgi:hypothetical protein
MQSYIFFLKIQPTGLKYDAENTEKVIIVMGKGYKMMDGRTFSIV